MKQNLSSGRYNRRRFLQGTTAAGVGGASLWLVGCGDDDDDEAPQPTPTPQPSNGDPTPTPANGTADPTPTEAPRIALWEWLQNEPDFSISPQSGGTLRYGTPIRAPSLDPVASASFEAAAVYTPVYNRLVRGEYGPEMSPFNPWLLNVTGDLAESWEQVDATTLVLSIRSGVQFQDVDPTNGRAFTAEDAKFSLDAYIANPEFADLLPISSVDVVDESTIRLTASRPVNYLIEALTESRLVMLAQEVAEADGDFSQRAIGTGPFIMESYVPGTSVRYVRNPNYYRDGLPYLDAIEFDSMPDAATSRSAFIADNYHVVRDGIGGGDDIRAVMNQRNDAVVLKLQSRWLSNIFHLGLNHRVAPYNDPRVRKAISMSYDRDAYGRTALSDDYNVLAPYSWIGWFNEEPDLGEAFQFDLGEARALLDAAAVGDITIPVEYFPYSQAITDQLQFMQEFLREIGVTLELNSTDYATFAGKYFAGQIEHGTVGFVPTFPRWQPLSMASLWESSSPKNYYGINDPDLDAAAAVVISTFDEEEQRAAYREIWNALTLTPHVVQMVEGPTHFAHSPKLHNFAHNMFNDWGGWGYQQMEQFWLEA
jgi:peptide/nickel transport system substrate-binding protein